MNYKMKRALMLLAMTAAMTNGSAKPENTERTIRNDCFWQTVDGETIYSQGGGIFRFEDPETKKMRYYWYGVKYYAAEEYRKDPSVTLPNAQYDCVTCYVSDDLVNWKSLGEAVSHEEIDKHAGQTWLGRLGVVKVDSVYAMFVQCGSRVLVAESANPAGPFKWGRLINMQDMVGTTNTGDQTVFVDEDTGKGYLVCSKGNGRNRIFVAEIGRTKDDSIGLLDCTKVYDGAGREGNCMFKYGGKYYLCASNLYGWDCSYAYFLVADNVKGPYREAIAYYKRPDNDYPLNISNAMQIMPGSERDYAHLSQTGFFYTLRGTNGELVLYCGDRWAEFAGNGIGYNQWVPLSFDGEVPHFNSLSEWHLDPKNASWSVGSKNNFAINGSFDADRRIIPLAAKPRQEYLTGWTTEFLKGSVATVADTLSPRLNHAKSREDRRQTVGEMALLITDRQHFERRVSQEITATPYVPLADGSYTLTAKVKIEQPLKQLQLFAETGGRTFKTSAKKQKGEWQTVELKGIRLTGGKVKIGIHAKGNANARCLVDDITLVRE